MHSHETLGIVFYIYNKRFTTKYQVFNDSFFIFWFCVEPHDQDVIIFCIAWLVIIHCLFVLHSKYLRVVLSFTLTAKSLCTKVPWPFETFGLITPLYFNLIEIPLHGSMLIFKKVYLDKWIKIFIKFNIIKYNSIFNKT